jgi:DNA replication and repair protein RecF
VPVSAEALSIDQLSLANFRNYARLRLEVGRRHVVLTGANGAGKTNLLEAVSLLAPGRGLRGVAFDAVQRRGSDGGWSISAEVDAGGLVVSLSTSYMSTGENPMSRRVAVDGIPQRGSAGLGRHMRILWLTPTMDRLFSGPPADRRRFLDRLVTAIDPAHAGRVSAFDRLLRERRRLLQSDGDRVWLDSVEHRLAEEGVALAAGRISALDALRGHIRREPEGGTFPWVSLNLVGEFEERLAATPAVQVEDEYRKILLDSRPLDRTTGRTLRGPHRSDMGVTHGPKGIPAGICSTGEQKALLIGIILAQARAVASAHAGGAPVLLFDEGLAHLDTERRLGLFGEIAALGAQSWFSGTDQLLFHGFDDDRLRLVIADGAATPIG